MSDICDAVGEAVTGAAIARAVEPTRGEAGDPPLKKGHFAESDCLNCGTKLTGPYCNECGQAAHLHRTLGGFLHDLSHGVMHFEGKTWRTLPLLAFRPGKLTRGYIEGERARFVSPMALFLFSVFMIFAVFSLLGISPPTTIEPSYTVDESAEAFVSDMQAERTELAEQLDAASVDEIDRAEIEQRIAGLDVAIENASTLRANLGDGWNMSIDSPDTGIESLDKGIEKWRENPGLMLYKMQANSYKFSWLLIPISLPLVWLIFAWKRRFGLYDHAIFITYSIAFMSLLFILLAIGALLGVPAWITATLGTTIPIMHIYGHVKGAYELTKFSAAWRTVALIVFIAIALLLFAAALLMLGMLG